jgi:outer membrane autotransporter protein
MIKPILTLVFFVVSAPVFSLDSPYSLSIGQKTVNYDVSGYEFDEISLVGLQASSSAIYANFSYKQDPSLSYSIEYGAFIDNQDAETNSISIGLEDKIEEMLNVIIEPTTYLSAFAQYSFRLDQTVKPYVVAGLSYISADITSESERIITSLANNTLKTTTNNNSTESNNSIGLVYGAGLDIQIVNDFSFTLDYRIQQDVADQSASELNGSLKYQF